ncbi:hypothetical protein BH23PAT2_BH23PAT2_10380 [soil metagenome]
MSRGKVYGQQPIEGAYRIELPNDEQVSFARVVAFQAERLALGSVPEDHVLRISAVHLRPDLIDVRSPGKTTGTYETERGRRVYTALTPEEYKLLPHYSAAIGRAALNGVSASRPEHGPPDIDEAAALRGGVHALEGYVSKSQNYLEQSLHVETKKLDRFTESIRNPGLRRKKGVTSRMDVDWVYEHHFGGMMKALRKQRKWRAEEEERARTALQYRLYGDREARNRVLNWADMVNLARSWNQEKTNLFEFKIAQAEVEIDMLKADADALENKED